MSGIAYLELVLVSMGWFGFVAGLALRLRVLPGIIGSVTVFFTVPLLGRHGVHVPWPWLWILLPLVLEVRWFARNRIPPSRNGPS